MGKLALYALAVFMETSIGIWIFGQVFPKRERMEKRHVFGEWLLFAVITLCAYSFPRLFWGIANEQNYVRNLALVHLILILVYVATGLLRKQNKTIRNVIVKGILFWGSILCLTAQFWVSYQSYQISLVGNVFPVLFLWIFYKCTFAEAYLWEFTYATNLGMLKNIYITYVGVFEQKSFEDFFYWPRSHTYKEAVYLLTIYFLLLLINKYIPLKNILSQILKRHKRPLFLFTLIEWLVLLIVIENGFGQIKDNNLTASLVLALIIVFCLAVLYIRSIIKVSSAEKKIFDMRAKAMADQDRELNIAYERYRCVVHDEKHMLLYLQECLRQNEVEEAKRFLNSYQQNLNRNGGCSWSGIANLDFLLNIKKPQMDRAAISFHLDCQMERILLEETDFVVVLGNLFDNAIEAAEKCEEGQREISLQLKNRNEMFYLVMRNSCKSQPRQKGSRFLTTKKNSDDHGWGIESVKHVVEKYQGSISFQYMDNYFEVKIMI